MKKSFWVRLLMSSLALILVLTSLTACGGGSSSESSQAQQSTSAAAGNQSADTPQKPDLYTIQILKNPDDIKVVKKSTDTDIGKVIKDKFNIEFEFIPASGDQREKQNLMLASGDYQEIMRIEGEDIVKKYIQAGAVFPLDDYLSDAPNFTALYKEQIPFWRLSGDDGKLYKWEMLVPQQIEAVLEVNDVAVRSDALEKQGWPQIVSEDDYYNFLKKGLADMPTTNGQKTIGMTIPLAESWGMTGLFIFLEKGGIYADSAGNDSACWNQVEQKFEHYFTNKYTLENFRFFNRLYREGLLDKECFTDFLPQVEQKMNSGRTLTAWYTVWDVDKANGELQKAGHPEMQYIKLPFRSNSQVKDGLKRQIRVETTRPFDSIVITRNAKDPGRIFELVEWASSDEGQILLQSGVEGKHYTVSDGKRVPTEEFFKGITGDPEYRERSGIHLYDFLGSPRSVAVKDGLAYDLIQAPEYRDKLFLSDRQKEAYQKLGWKTSADYWLSTGIAAPTGLAPSVSIDPSSEVGKMNQKLTEFRVKAAAALVTAKSDEEYDRLLNQFLEDYKKLNPDQVISKYNEILAENKAKLDKYAK